MGGIYKIAGLNGLSGLGGFDVNVKLNNIELENARDVIEWFIAIMENLMHTVM